MRVADWLAGYNLTAMYAAWHAAWVDDRRYRLFACSCCREAARLRPLCERGEAALAAAERYAEGGQLPSALYPHSGNFPGAWLSNERGTDCASCAVLGRVHCDSGSLPLPDRALAALMREAAGWPAHRPRVPGSADTLALSLAAYDDRLPGGDLRPATLAVLGDAATDAGCEDAHLLWHRRGYEPCWLCAAGGHGGDEGCGGRGYGACRCCARAHGYVPLSVPHYRGCWAVEALRGHT